MDTRDRRSRYARFAEYLFRGDDSVSDLLTWASGSPGLRLVTFTFNDPDERDLGVEKNIMQRSVYRENGLIVLPNHGGGFTTDQIVLTVPHFLAYALTGSQLMTAVCMPC